MELSDSSNVAVGVDDVSSSEFHDVELHNKIKEIVQTKLMEHDQEHMKISKALPTDGSQSINTRVLFHVKFLTEIAEQFSNRVINDPALYVPAFEDAVNEVARQFVQLQQGKAPVGHIRVGFEGWLGGHSVTPRGIRAELANKIILVEGIVIRCTPPASRLQTGAYYVPELGRHVFKDYADKYALLPAHRQKQLAGFSSILSKDPDGKTMELEYGLSNFKDYQWITLQEMPEVTPLGQLPRSIEVLVEHDLVDKVKPGDRTRVCGILKPFVHAPGAVVTGGATVCLIANNITHLQIDHLTRKIEPSMIKLFNELASDPNTLDLIANSIAPSINGHKRVRQGIALQLAGGVTQDCKDGLRRRGDIHILLLGDPSCGKSQMLRYALKLAPLAVSATGRGSSAVGLTAAVTTDAATGHKRLEAGAMVVADRGLVCIDEFDKMGNDDRSAVHEVMEQQQVSIFKANISAVLNARASVLAAANPIYGNFNDGMDFAKQVNFPDSLLSRFDLIFLIRESQTAEQDRRIAQQVLSQLRAVKKDALEDTRRHRAMRADIMVPTLLQPRDETADKQQDVPVKRLMWVHNASDGVGRGKGKLSADAVRTAKAARLLQPEFLKQFLIYARFSVNPRITAEAEDEIADFYGYLRERIRKEWEKSGVQRAVPTPRLLEALIRLSTAHAKLKLKKEVDLDDVSAAKSLIVYTLLGFEDEEENETASEHVSAEPVTRGQKRGRKARDESTEALVKSVSDDIENLQLEDEPARGRKKKANNATAAPTPPAAAAAASTASSLEIDEIWSCIESLRDETGEDDWDIDHVYKTVKKLHRNISRNVFNECLKKLQSQNRIMNVGARCYIV